MLVLTRKVGEKLVIGDQITVVVNRVSGNRISLGIEAPPHVRIVRGELKSERSSATTSTGDHPSEVDLDTDRRTDRELADETTGDSGGVDWPSFVLAGGVMVERVG